MYFKSNSIKVRIVGGLGNQLFGAFFGLAISERINTRLVLDATFVSLGSNPTRKLAVSEFNLNPFPITIVGTIIEKIPYLTRISLIRKIASKILRNVKRSIPEEKVIDSFAFKAGQAFTGYFHKWSYADYFLQRHPSFKLTLKSKSQQLITIEKIFKSKDPICVHVRLGDFLVHSNLYSKLPETYYLESIAQIKKIYLNREVWVFTENQSELSAHYPNLSNICNFIVDQDTSISDAEAFYLLTTSKFLITSNSTFSLWAAWFVEKSNNFAIVPSFNTNADLNEGLLDKRWNSVNTETLEFMLAKK